MQVVIYVKPKTYKDRLKLMNYYYKRGYNIEEIDGCLYIEKENNYGKHTKNKSK